jgi:circadian clock protein KaiB
MAQQEEDQLSQTTLEELEKLVAELANLTYVFRLYISGTTAKSSRAVANVQQICDQYLPGRYQLEVIDVYQHPEVAREQQVIALPTLIKEFPLPTQKFVGDMSSKDKIVIGLKLKN